MMMNQNKNNLKKVAILLSVGSMLLCGAVAHADDVSATNGSVVNTVGGVAGAYVEARNFADDKTAQNRAKQEVIGGGIGAGVGVVNDVTGGAVGSAMGTAGNAMGAYQDVKNFSTGQTAPNYTKQGAVNAGIGVADGMTDGAVGSAMGAAGNAMGAYSDVKDFAGNKAAQNQMRKEAIGAGIGTGIGVANDVTGGAVSGAMGTIGNAMGAYGDVMSLSNRDSYAREALQRRLIDTALQEGSPYVTQAMNVTGDYLGGSGIGSALSSVLNGAKGLFGSVKGAINKGHSWEEILDIGWGGMLESSAFSAIQSSIGSLAGAVSSMDPLVADAMGDYKQGKRHNISETGKDFLSRVQADIQQMVIQKTMGFANGGSIAQLLDLESMKALNLAFGQAPPEGLPTTDMMNLTLGVYNVSSVYGHSYEQEDIRDFNTQFCTSMGVSDPGWNIQIRENEKTPGEYCCEQWLEAGANQLNSQLGKVSQGIISVVDKLSDVGLIKNYCCSVMPDLCKTIDQLQADCLNGELAGGKSAEEGWKSCQIECGDRDYGELVYHPDTGYDPTQIETMMKECYKTGDKTPSTTVLTSSEMAPVVPSEITGLLRTGAAQVNEWTAGMNQQKEEYLNMLKNQRTSAQQIYGDYLNQAGSFLSDTKSSASTYYQDNLSSHTGTQEDWNAINSGITNFRETLNGGATGQYNYGGQYNYQYNYGGKI